MLKNATEILSKKEKTRIAKIIANAFIREGIRMDIIEKKEEKKL